MNFREAARHLGAMAALVSIATTLTVCPLIFLGCWYSPIINVPIRIATIVFGLLTIGCLLFVVRQNRKWFFGISALLALSVMFLALPSHPPQDRAFLQTAYADALETYSDCPYVWGGEGRFGIDCSGLVRRAMEDTLVQQGVLHLNPALVRSGISLWWHDTTAREIGRGYNGRTRVIATCRSLNTFDHTQLQPGDLAVTTTGVHVMAYLGNNRWIAADPGAEKVVSFTVPVANDGYFVIPMNLVRWRILEQSPSAP